MTTELKEAILKVEQLPDVDQIEIARMMTEEINWDKTFSKTQNNLEKLAQQAIEEHLSGNTKNEDW